jgi:hypothetical protein
MWQVKAVSIPKNDYLSKQKNNRHFRDALAVPLQKKHLQPDQIQLAIFGYMPNWVNRMMTLRDKMVRSLGFNTGEGMMSTQVPEALDEGDRAGFLTIIQKDDQEIISLAEDKHMQFYLSVRKEESQAVVSCLVNPTSKIGWLYLQLILPFHWLIARSVLHNAAKKQRL